MKNDVITMPVLLLMVLISFTSCNNRPSGEKPAETGKQTKPEVFVPGFNADSAYFYIEKQVAFGPRVPNTAAHKACAVWLENPLKRFTAEVVVQQTRLKASDGTLLDSRNIIASFNPEDKSRVLLCAHWDSRPWADHDPDPANRRKPVPAANDGGSGGGVLLEIARQMSQHNPGLGVDIVLFDAEDYGDHEESASSTQDSWGLGSQYWSRNPHVPGYSARFGILLDMVGANGATFTMEGTSMYYAPEIMRRVWDVAHRLGYEEFFLKRQTGGLTDDHLYVNEITGIPTIDIIDYNPDREKGFFDYWHTVKDDMSNISKTTLHAVGHTVLTVVYESV